LPPTGGKGPDVLIAGTEVFGAAGVKPCYWLNGARHEIPVPGTFGYANAIAVSGSDVYIAGNSCGEEDYMPGYWFNSTWHELPVPGIFGYANAIAVSGSDVYITGYIMGCESDATPCYWLNGAWHDLPFPGTSGFANAIAVSGSGVYIAGSDGSGPCYWLNGERWYALPVTTGAKGAASAIVLR
jgi:hypothetical protein